MGTANWQRQLLATLSRLEESTSGMRGDMAGMRGDIAEMRGDIAEMRGDIAEMRGDIASLREGQDEMRGDIRMLTRVVVRRFGTAGTAIPQVGDHVLFHLQPDAVRPAIVLEVNGDHLDLEVFGAGMTAPERFPTRVAPGMAPGCWSFPN